MKGENVMGKLLGLAELFFYPFYVIPAFLVMAIKASITGKSIDPDEASKLFNPMDGLLG